MKNKKIIAFGIGALVVAAFFLLKKKKWNRAKEIEKFKKTLPNDKNQLILMFLESKGYDNTQKERDYANTMSVDELKYQIANAKVPDDAPMNIPEIGF